MSDSLVPGTVRFDPKPRIFGTAWLVSALLGHRSVCLGLPCKGINQSIVGLSPFLRLLIQLAMISP
jgi:hypothetical protein